MLRIFFPVTKVIFGTKKCSETAVTARYRFINFFFKIASYFPERYQNFEILESNNFKTNYI